MTQKIVINRCYGGFCVSEEAHKRYAEIAGIDVWVEREKNSLLGPTYWRVPPEQWMKDPMGDESAPWHEMTLEERQEFNQSWQDKTFRLSDDNRADPVFIQVVEELGEKASGRFGQLEIVEIPDDVEWTIEEYDGVEWIAEKHRTWR